jgi:signal transduction histidine kinase/TPR repeat protein
MRKLYLVIVFFSLSAYTQNKEQLVVDSLIVLAKQNSGFNPKKMQEYCKAASELAQKIDYKKGFASATRFYGASYYLLGNFAEAKNYFLKALKINEDIKDPTGIMASLSNLGSVNNVQNKYPIALDYYQKAIKIGEKLNDIQTMGVTYGNMGIIYNEIKNYGLALKHFEGGLELHKKINYGVGIATGLGNIGNVYFYKKDYVKAQEYYQKALDKNIEINNKPGISREYGNIANVYTELKDFDKSFVNHQKALSINEELKNKKGISVNYQGIGKYYLESSKYDEALHFLKRANALAKSINIQDVQKESYQDISTTFEKKGKLDSAYFYFKKYIDIKDNIDNENNRKQISRLEIQYEFDSKEEKYKTEQLLSNEKLIQQELLLQLNNSKLNESNKEKDLARLNYLKTQSELKTEQIEKKAQKKQLDIIQKDNLLKQNQLKINQLQLQAKEKQKWFYISGIGLLIIIGGLLFYQSRNRKKTNQKLQLLNTELDQANKIKTRFFSILNHDLRSPVANLIHFLHLQKENPELLDEATKTRMQNKTIAGAENLLASMEDILLWSKGQMVNFKPEPKSIALNQLFDDTKKVFSGHQQIKIDYQNPQDISLFTDENYLKTIVRNLTSNAINAFTTTKKPHIIWKAWQENNINYLSITDNGPGASQEQFKALYDDKEVVGIKTGLGLHLIRDLAKAINCEIKVSSTINQGTTITITL